MWDSNKNLNMCEPPWIIKLCDLYIKHLLVLSTKHNLSCKGQYSMQCYLLPIYDILNSVRGSVVF